LPAAITGAINNFTTLADRQALFNDTVSAWRRAAATLNSHDKQLIITMYASLYYPLWHR